LPGFAGCSYIIVTPSLRHRHATIAQTIAQEEQGYCNIADNLDVINLHNDGRFVHSIHLYFACSLVGGELSREYFDENEKIYAEMPEWVTLGKIGEIKMFCSVEPKEVLKALSKNGTS
jgi:hypothetical protein